MSRFIPSLAVLSSLVFLALAADLNAQEASYYYERGSNWDQKGDYDKAVADLSQALRIDPYYADAYYQRAYAWRKKR